MRREPPEKFRAGKNNQISGRKIKSMRERALEKLNVREKILIVDDFAKPFDLAFGLKIDHHPRLLFTPLLQVLDELSALRFGKGEIADAKLAHRRCRGYERAAKVFRSPLDPTLADLYLWRRFAEIFGLSRIDLDRDVVVIDVITNRRILIFPTAEQNVDAVQIADRSLHVDIELAQGFDFVAAKFDSHRQCRLPGINIDNAAADGEMATDRGLNNALITGADKFFEEGVHLVRLTASQPKQTGQNGARLGRG